MLWTYIAFTQFNVRLGDIINHLLHPIISSSPSCHLHHSPPSVHPVLPPCPLVLLANFSPHFHLHSLVHPTITLPHSSPHPWVFVWRLGSFYKTSQLLQNYWQWSLPKITNEHQWNTFNSFKGASHRWHLVLFAKVHQMCHTRPPHTVSKVSLQCLVTAGWWTKLTAVSIYRGGLDRGSEVWCFLMSDRRTGLTHQINFKTRIASVPVSASEPSPLVSQHTKDGG